MTSLQTAQHEVESSAGTSNGKLFVVASDGRADSDPAFEMAKLLAGATGNVLGVAVLDQVNLVPESQVLFSAEIETARRNELQERLQSQIKRTVGKAVPHELYDGDPARLIAQTATRSGAAMILAGIGRHGIPARLFGNETVLRIMRISELPVLAVARDMRHLPRRIVAAIDFSEASIRALRLAVSLAAPGATVFLVHVGPRDSLLYDWEKSYKRNIFEALNALKQQLALPAGVVFNAVLLQGDPATELLAHAKNVGADLIATGSHGHGFVSRLLIGSVGTRLVRGSSCSVLAVPQSMARPLATPTASGGRAVIPAQWSALLDDVSKQNIGRLSSLEEDATNIGAQIEERMLPFMGATYDPYDGHVQLMFAETDAPLRHLTRNIGEVSSIEVLQNERGQDVALRIGHGDGQSLLTFRPMDLDF